MEHLQEQSAELKRNNLTCSPDTNFIENKVTDDINETKTSREDSLKHTTVILTAGLAEVIVDNTEVNNSVQASKLEGNLKAVIGLDRLVSGTLRCHRGWILFVESIQKHVHGFLTINHSVIVKVFIGILLITYAVYLGFAVWFSVWGARVILSTTVFILAVLGLRLINWKFGQRIDSLVCAPIRGMTHTRGCLFFKW